MTTAFQIGAFQFDAFQEDAVVGTISATDQLDTALISGQVLITGSISATDQLDTANIQGQVLVSGAISTTDQADTASILGNVLVSGAISTTDALDTASILGTVSIIGNIYATDQADTALITGIVQSGVTPDTHDGFTPEEVRRWKQIQKKIAKAEAQKRQALLEKRKLRRKQIEEIVSPPVAQIQQVNVESPKEVKIGKPPIDIRKVNAVIANLDRQKQKLLQAVAYRQEIARLQSELSIIEAKQKAELDDEESILLLM